MAFYKTKVSIKNVIITTQISRFYTTFGPNCDSMFAVPKQITMTQINAYLTFNGNCREVMTFYKDCLGAELAMQTVEGSAIEHQCPAAMKGQVLHASVMKEGLLLMGSDMIGPEGFVKGNTVALSLNCSSEEEINTFFNTLSDGGQIIHPLKMEFWGAIFGVFTDKYGMRWMLNYEKNNER
jgi:PhnB protein